MSWEELLDTSSAISSGKYFCKSYLCIERTVTKAYCNSQVYKLVNTFNANVNFFFTCSFLTRIAEIKQTTTPVILSNSCMVKSALALYKNFQIKLINYFKVSLVAKALNDLKTELYFSPIRIISIFMVIVITVNLVLCLVLKKEMSIWGYLMRGLFLFAGIPGLFCKVDWPTLKENSIFFRNTVS